MGASFTNGCLNNSSLLILWSSLYTSNFDIKSLHSSEIFTPPKLLSNWLSLSGSILEMVRCSDFNCSKEWMWRNSPRPIIISYNIKPRAHRSTFSSYCLAQAITSGAQQIGVPIPCDSMRTCLSFSSFLLSPKSVIFKLVLSS